MDSYANILVGLGYGDEGKGTTTDYLCREQRCNLVVRYNGGSQAGHNVVTPNGTHHCFSMFGSGAFSGTATLLSQYCMVDPFVLARETSELSPKLEYNALNQHFIDYRAPIITPFHVAANRIREWMRDKPNGSCGKGIGELAFDTLTYPNMVLRMGNLGGYNLTCGLLKAIQDNKRSRVPKEVLDNPPKHLKEWVDLLNDPGRPERIAINYGNIRKMCHVLDEVEIRKLMTGSRIIFEGAQGMGLDEIYGFHPHTTWSNCTPLNALKIMAEVEFQGLVEVTGIVRSYATRHGAGPFVTEQSSMTSISPKEHNQTVDWQGNFRVGYFDTLLTNYSATLIAQHVPSLTGVMVTHMDIWRNSELARTACMSYQYPADGWMDKLPMPTTTPDGVTLLNTKLTDTLKMCSPCDIMACTPDCEDQFIYLVSKACNGARVTHISDGPTCRDKKKIPLQY